MVAVDSVCFEFLGFRNCCLLVAQAERDILQLEEAGESAAAAALRRKVERPVLSGKRMHGWLL